MKRTGLIILSVLIILLSWMIVANQELKRKNTAEKPASFSQQLFESRNLYVGNNSADGKILGLLNVSKKLGKYTIELQTTQEPYRLKLNFLDPVTERDAFDKLMRKYALIILALIDNAGEVQWSYPSVEGNRDIRINAKVSLQDARNIVGKDIKAYGKTPNQVQELLNQLEVTNP